MSVQDPRNIGATKTFEEEETTGVAGVGVVEEVEAEVEVAETYTWAHTPQSSGRSCLLKIRSEFLNGVRSQLIKRLKELTHLKALEMNSW